MLLKEKNTKDDIYSVIKRKRIGEEPESILQASGQSISYGGTLRLSVRIFVELKADSINIEESNEDIIRGLL